MFNRVVVFDMLRRIKSKASGVEYSAYRRAQMLRKQLGLEVNLVTHEYQNDLLEQRDAYGINFRVLNMYDYYQGVNRNATEPRTFEPKYVTTPTRRDTYDELGFLSRRQDFDPQTLRREDFYYRQDGTPAIRETYERNDLKSMELINRRGEVTKTFTNHEGAMKHWLLSLLTDETQNYLLIGDRTPEWETTYRAIEAAGLANVRVVHQLHNIHVVGDLNPFTAPTKPRHKFLIDKTIRADAILALTAQQTADIIARYHLSNVFYIPHPLPKVAAVNVKVNPLLVVMVGRFVKEKGHVKAIKAFRRVLKKVPQAQLHFYGNGTLQKTIQAKIDSLGLGASIKLKGFVDNINEIFASAAMSILPSTKEGSPLVIQESLQNNCPVVAFDCRYGPRDSIVDGVNGYLIEVDDVAALADRIIKILTEPGLRDKLATNCARSVEKYSPELVADKWRHLLKEELKLC